MHAGVNTCEHGRDGGVGAPKASSNVNKTTATACGARGSASHSFSCACETRSRSSAAFAMPAMPSIARDGLCEAMTIALREA